MNTPDIRPLVLITGAAGNLGQALACSLSDSYRVVGLGRTAQESPFPILQVDFSSAASIELALHKLRESFGARFASVVHLVAYFDFSNADDPRYQSVNVEGTRHLLHALQVFEVEQFVYVSTMLVHAPCRPGERIDESHPIGPRWAYPKSKAAAEEVVRQEHGAIPCVTLRLAGVYDDHSLVPTMAQQFARIYERDMQSYFYSGSTLVGQAMLHRDDMLDAFHRTIDRRRSLGNETAILVGEADAIGYDALQDCLGALMHGVDDWPTLQVPKSIAAAGLWALTRLEPLIPDAIDKGQAPFVRPFMAEMADDHYALDTRRARDLLGWEAHHSFRDELPRLVQSLKDDPPDWYRRNGVTPPRWVTAASEAPETLRQRYRQQFAAELGDNRWPHFVNIALGSWLFTQPLLIAVQEPMLRWSEMGLGIMLMIFAMAALSERGTAARWVCACIGAVVMAIPFLFHTGNAAAYLSDTLVGALIFGFAVCTKPEPGPSALAALTGPDIPPGWSYNPSAWSQRLPIIATALIGLFVARYLAAYQLGHIPAVWDPFFAGSSTDPQNGTEEIITSALSKAFPVSDAALGGYTYLLEILTGLVGAKARWRTMPWLVVLFGLMIAPLGITSILFVIIQPIVIGTWSIVALIGAAAILIQIPYSLDEIIATLQFMRRRVQAGRNGLVVFFRGDTDTMPSRAGDRGAEADEADEFAQRPGAVLHSMLAGGVNLPWSLGLAALIGLALMFTRLWPGVEGNLAHAHHLIGSLVLTVVSIAAAEVARPARWLNVPLGAGLIASPFMFSGSTAALVCSVLAGLALMVLSIRRGPVREHYGSWDQVIA
jgi:nucleoside-diphosphate-sugar epimerase